MTAKTDYLEEELGLTLKFTINNYRGNFAGYAG
jgi:hypothetical protein